MGRIIFFFAIVILIIGIVLYCIYKYKPKYLWLVPVAAVAASGFLLLKDIISYTASEPTVAKKLAHYFHNDVSMGFYLVYAPVTVIAVIMTIIAYVLNHYTKKT